LENRNKSKAGAGIQSQNQGSERAGNQITYGMAQYKWMLIGIGFIALGMILMSGGWMPSPEVWDESIIYSPVRLTVAPICIIIGLILQVYAIFKV
jgi:hypothetical protein